MRASPSVRSCATRGRSSIGISTSAICKISPGPVSLLFCDGVFSHAVCKRPKVGDYRVQFQFGGTDEDAQVSEELVAQARICVAHAPAPTIYARVDGVVRDGKFLLMELEVFEPLMYLSRHPEASARFARAIEKPLLPG